MTRHQPRRGFTLFQLLILIAVLALLLALFLPATVQIRLAAARMASSNNLKQIALAMHNYHDTNNNFPAGVAKNGFSPHALALPYVEQDNAYRLIDFTKASTDKANAQPRNLRIKVFLSPLDNTPIMTESGPTNYLANAGAKADLKNNDGVFYLDSKLRLTDCLDGTSNTIMFGETLRGDGGVRAMNVARQHVAHKADALKGIKADAGADDWKNDKSIAADRGAAWMDGRFLQTTFTATLAFNDERPDVDCGGAGGVSGLRSGIPQIMTAFCDGSVRSVNVGVKLETWQAVCTRNGGEVVNDF